LQLGTPVVFRAQTIKVCPRPWPRARLPLGHIGAGRIPTDRRVWTSRIVFARSEKTDRSRLFLEIPGCAVSRSRRCRGRCPRHANLVRRCRHAPLPHGLHVFCVAKHEERASMAYALLHCAPPVHMVPFPQITAQKLFPFSSWTQHVLPAQRCNPLQPS